MSVIKVTIEAIQLTTESLQQCKEFINEKLPVMRVGDDGGMLVKNPDETILVFWGDYIIKDTNGTFSRMDKNSFLKLYGKHGSNESNLDDKFSFDEYQSIKTVHAVPFSSDEWMNFRTTLTDGYNNSTVKPGQDGYLVCYSKGTPEQYLSWSPKKQFEDGYKWLTPPGVVSACVKA